MDAGQGGDAVTGAQEDIKPSMSKGLVRLLVLGLVFVAPPFVAAVDYIALLVGYRLLLPRVPWLFGQADSAEVSDWAWQFALWRLPLYLITMLLFSGRAMWISLRTGQEWGPPEKTVMTRFPFNAVDPVLSFAVALAVLGEHVGDRRRLFALAAVSVLLVNWMLLPGLLFKRVLRPAFKYMLRPALKHLGLAVYWVLLWPIYIVLLRPLHKHVLRPIGQAWGRVIDEGVAEVRTCETGKSRLGSGGNGESTDERPANLLSIKVCRRCA